MDWNVSVAVGVSFVVVLLSICYRQKPVDAELISGYFISKKELISLDYYS